LAAVAIVAVAILGSLGYGAFLLPGGLLGGCGHEVLQTQTSPEGRLDAHVVRNNCGATTAYSVSIVLAPVGKAFDHKDALKVAQFKWDEAKAAWQGRGLIVTIDDRAEPFQKDAEGLGVPVTYRFTHEPGPARNPAEEAWIREQEAKQGVVLR
jgi:hypothetical protein